MLNTELLLLAQAQAQTQTEYLLATGLTVAMVLLGVLVVCIPRPRNKHFVEPDDAKEDSKRKKKRR